MKPLRIVVLILAGALGGAVVMKVVERPKAAPASTAQVQIPTKPAPAAQPQAAEPAPPAATAPAPAQAAPAAEPVAPKPEAKPSPLVKSAGHPKPVARKAAVVAAKVASPARPEAPAPPAPAASVPAPAPAAPAVETAPPQPPLSARVEPEPATPPPPPPAPERPTVTLNAGMLVPVRLVDGLSSERNVAGDFFAGTLDKELVVDGFVIAERGARVEGRVVAADKGGKVRGVAALAVELNKIRLSDGQTIRVQTDSFEKHAADTHGQDAAKVGIGAAIGAVIGAAAGGGKGAAIGAGVGGGAGAGDVLLTRGKPATLPSETRISFRLRAPVTVTEH